MQVWIIMEVRSATCWPEGSMGMLMVIREGGWRGGSLGRVTPGPYPPPGPSPQDIHGRIPDGKHILERYGRKVCLHTPVTLLRRVGG